MRGKKLSLDEHRKLAASLQSMRRSIGEIYNTISSCRLTTRVGQKVYCAKLRLREIKSELEAILFRDHPAETSLEIHYGRHEG